jgi:putative intracellular protease/amidase
MEKFKNTKKLKDFEGGDFQFVFVIGCRGAMVDIASSTEVCKVCCSVYNDQEGFICTISHGAAGLIPLKPEAGHLIDGVRITGYTDEEERKKGTEEEVPFSLERKLRDLGGLFEKDEPFKPHVVCDKRFITAQNPQSAKEWIRKILECLKQQE